MNGLTAYALSKKYTEDSLMGAGALKGEKGEDGLSIKALSITQDDTGKIVDATATLSNNSTLKVDIITSGTPGEERLEGDGAEYYTLAPTPLSFRSDAPLNELQDVQINGVTVDPSNYTLEEGSTIVTLSIDYLKTLYTGSHEVAIVFESKTVRGGFEVKSPALNEHGFYYNQPYTANLPMFGGDTALFVREDGTYDIITVGKNPNTGEYTLDGNNIVATHPLLGTITCTISSDRRSIYCNEVGATFELLGSISIIADDDYVYTYKEELGGYEVIVIDKTKAEYGDIRTGIYGIDTVKLADNAFLKIEAGIWIGSNMTIAPQIPNTVTTIGNNAFFNCTSLGGLHLHNGIERIGESAFHNCTSLRWANMPDSITSIGENAFYNCTSLTGIYIPDGVTSIEASTFHNCISFIGVNIPNGVTSIGAYAFAGCEACTQINFLGTIAQWNSITLGENWNLNVPATHVQCSDGTVEL